MDNPFEQRRDIRGTKTYWKLRGLVRELLESESECLICGSRNDLEAHHVIKCATMNISMWKGTIWSAFAISAIQDIISKIPTASTSKL